MKHVVADVLHEQRSMIGVSLPRREKSGMKPPVYIDSAGSPYMGGARFGAVLRAGRSLPSLSSPEAKSIALYLSEQFER